ncbi:hypothetical protein [Streptomyces cavernicola]|uniref:Uncharacterized protein n=1 Tax=Streptomyces cavernicola TaxID=3043613 RepID=A0ABT6S349_9ACTN|nr:hypothetical protein [Streptomyces sp. B-S-A6]MDI3402528.1 hypothetical protein [Streptomyces sp. B-S-A6]
MRAMGAEEAAYVRRVKEALEPGYIGEENAAGVQRALPDVSERIVGLLAAAAEAEEWFEFTRLANLGRWVAPAGPLADQLIPVLELRPWGANKEDLAEILGEIESVAAVPTLIRVFEEELVDDAPAYWLCKTCVDALGTVHFVYGAEGDGGASGFLREVATGDYPDQLRWEAAVELQIEDELGFDEDEMTA